MLTSRMLLGSLSSLLVICGATHSSEPEILSVEKIWNQGEHNAFTDLIRFENRWWCTFREAKDHGPSIGKVRVITSEDGEKWASAGLLEQDGVDLRDPKLSIMPDGRLMLIMGGSVYHVGGRYGTRAPRVSFSKNGRDWTEPKKLLAEDHWLWRVTWQGEWGWSVSKLGEGRDPRRGMVYRTRDGLDWEWITEFRLPNNTWNASETTLRFMPNGELIALTRPHWIGKSTAPYTSWSWTKMQENIGGPNFIRLPDGQLWASGRHYGDQATTVLARMTYDSYDPVLTLPSGGDCSYAGMVWHEGLLWMSYYSSHEGKTSIYLAKIRLSSDADRHESPTTNNSDHSRYTPRDKAGLGAVTRQRRHPVLIRNEHNPLIQVVITANRSDLQVTSFHFSLEGTDDTSNIESLELLSTVDKTEFSAANRFGPSARAVGSPSFRGEQKLREGKNVFWLSCRIRPGANLGHKVDAVCTEVETSAGKMTPRDETPGVRKRIGIALRKHNDDGVHTYRIPALATTRDGTLLCVYDMRRRRSRDLQEDIDIGLSRSSDGGRTWEAPQVIMDMGQHGGLPQEQNGCSDPGIIVDPQTGEIFVAAVWMWGKPGKHQWNEGGSEPGYEIGKAAQFLMVKSKDDGRTWTKPENWTRRLKQEDWILFAPSPQQGISLPDGTLVWPTQGRDAQDRHFSTIMISRDHGEAWTVGSTTATGNTECQAVQLGDGTIMLNARTESPTKFRSVYVTTDLGKTWTMHATHRNTLIEPNCNGSTYRFDYDEDGKRKHILIFANPHSQQARDHHTIQVSFDDGRTWPDEYRLLLDEGRGRGYPSISRVDDRHVGIVYEGSQADLVFEKLSLDELIGGRKPR